MHSGFLKNGLFGIEIRPPGSGRLVFKKILNSKILNFWRNERAASARV